jgi:ATP-dependent RNA helicase SUPV3L1/SUV3
MKVKKFSFAQKAKSSDSKIVTKHSPTFQHRVKAVLGPTNTGKTHLALERLMAHPSGMIGFPLRLLARENYERVVRVKGASQVALITGEEKIIPPQPRYFLCTVESMPLTRPVDFLAVDEIQLCADKERGHIFTERLLSARGQSETMMLGSDTMRSVIQKLIPHAEFIARPRLSQLSYSGVKKLTRLPARCAIVAFSANDVYAIAELIRRQHGGAAIVMGALSPRTRNAQVALYQAGEVDYLVATDAIGMGLNMDVHHVAFARLSKYDGELARPLTAMEMGQIAGRAGRHLCNGSFGTTEEVGPLDAGLVERLEAHRYDTVQQLVWRNSDLDFSSPEHLLKSLDLSPDLRCFTPRRQAEDHRAFLALLEEGDIARQARGVDSVKLLWEVASVPDFRKTLPEQHWRLLGQLYRFLRGIDALAKPGARRGFLPNAWIERQLQELDRCEGDIDSLMARIAHIRTWTYITHRQDWVEVQAGWQEQTRSIEDRLSDALHERLTQRFIERRSALLVRGLQKGTNLRGFLHPTTQALWIEGEEVGTLAGFRFVPKPELGAAQDVRAILAALRRFMPADIERRVQQLEITPLEEVSLGGNGEFLWQGAALGRLQAGGDVLHPKLTLYPSELLSGGQAERVRLRLEYFLQRLILENLSTLKSLQAAENLPGAARGLAYRLAEAFGNLPVHLEQGSLGQIDPKMRQALRGQGVVFGRHYLWLAPLLHGPSAWLRALLAAIFWRLPPAQCASFTGSFNGALSLLMIADLPPALYEACGYMPLASGRAVRLDGIEKVAQHARKALAAALKLPSQPKASDAAQLPDHNRQDKVGGRKERQIGFTAHPAWAKFIEGTAWDVALLLRHFGYQPLVQKVPLQNGEELVQYWQITRHFGGTASSLPPLGVVKASPILREAVYGSKNIKKPHKIPYALQRTPKILATIEQLQEKYTRKPHR